MPTTLTHADRVNHQAILKGDRCNMCNSQFTKYNGPIEDHDHLTGEYRQTICNNCNLFLKTPKFIPCLIHNLSNYDGHFITTELGYDTKSISVIPYSEKNLFHF